MPHYDDQLIVGQPMSTSLGRARSFVLHTTAVQTMRGYLGQVRLDAEIVFETEACETAEEAIETATASMRAAFLGMFAQSTAALTGGSSDTGSGDAGTAASSGGPQPEPPDVPGGNPLGTSGDDLAAPVSGTDVTNGGPA